jgi:endonuclease YncB( thermonuclease family)
MSDAGLWRYRAALRRVIDGDTLEITMDMGVEFILRKFTIRLVGINCPEVEGPQKPAGLAAKAYAEQWCQLALDPATAWPLRVETIQDDEKEKYGRYLARVYRGDQRCLNSDLVAAGHAVPYTGKGPRPV